MASAKAFLGNKCITNKAFTKQVKSGQKLKISAVEEKDNQYGTDPVLGISFKETKGFLRVNATNNSTLATAYGDDTDDWVGKFIVYSTREREVDGKTCAEIILAPIK